MKAALFCSCAFLLLAGPLKIGATSAEDIGLLASADPILPVGTSNGAKNMMDFSTPRAVSVLPANGASLLPGNSPVVASTPVLPASQQPVLIQHDYVPGENPFVAKSVAITAPVARPSAEIRPAAGTFALSQSASSTGNAQVASLEMQVQNAAASPSVNQDAKVDETALRYYASTRDLKRLGAELRRLKALYPSWQTPENLFDPVSNVQEQPLWDMFGTGNYAGVRAEISRLQASNPEWKPSKDLLTKLSLGETRKVLDRAYSQKNWLQVVSMAQQTPQLLVCAEMNTLWQVGEALAQSKNLARSFELYKYILSNCTNPEERLSTVQKAALVLPDVGLQSLIALGTVQPDGTQEFEAVGYDQLRHNMGAIASGDKTIGSISQDKLETFSAYVQKTTAGKDAGLFGWYYYSQQDWQAAKAWFTTAYQFDNDPKNIEGVVLSLRNAGNATDALALAKRFSDRSPELTKEYIEIVAASLTDKDQKNAPSDKELVDFKDAVFAAKSAVGAQALGWKMLSQSDSKQAASLFEQSVAWEPTEGGVVGLGVLAVRSKNSSQLASLKSNYGSDFSALNTLKIYGKNKPSYKKNRSTQRVVPKDKVQQVGLLSKLFH